MRMLAVLLMSLVAAPAMAHPGLHHHPHGAESVWLGALLAILAAGVAAMALRGRK